MRAISIWEPFASLMACGAKTIETRGWPTRYRGPLLICASRRRIDDVGLEVLGVAKSMGYAKGLYVQELRYGMAVCVVDLIRCDLIAPGYSDGIECELGDYTPGRYAWATTNLRRIWPVPVVGRQGLFEVSDEVVRYVE